MENNKSSDSSKLCDGDRNDSRDLSKSLELFSDDDDVVMHHKVVSDNRKSLPNTSQVPLPDETTASTTTPNKTICVDYSYHESPDRMSFLSPAAVPLPVATSPYITTADCSPRTPLNGFDNLCGELDSPANVDKDVSPIRYSSVIFSSKSNYERGVTTASNTYTTGLVAVSVCSDNEDHGDDRTAGSKVKVTPHDSVLVPNVQEGEGLHPSYAAALDYSPLPLRQRLGRVNVFDKKNPISNAKNISDDDQKSEQRTCYTNLDSLAGTKKAADEKVREEGIQSKENITKKTSSNKTETANKSKKKIGTAVANCRVEKLSKKNKCQVKRSTAPSPFTPMPGYDEMATPELKHAVGKIGVKPVGKKRMRQLLKHVYHQTHQYETDSDYEGTPVKRCEASSSAKPSTLSFDGDRTAAELCPKKEAKCKSSSDVSKESSLVDTTRLKIPQFSIAEATTNTDIYSTQFDSSHSDDDNNRGELLEESVMVSWSDDHGDFDDPSNTQLPSQRGGSRINNNDPEVIAERLRGFISANREIYEKVLTYEPLELDLLKQALVAAGIKTGLGKVVEFLDNECITFTMKNMTNRNIGNSKGRGRQKKKKTQMKTLQKDHGQKN